MSFQTTRKAIIEAAETMLGLPFIHQGRSSETGVDCVGLLVVIGNMIGYPEVFDVEGYRRTPSAQVIRDTLRKNCDEIAVEDAKIGDIYLMRMGGIKPRHASILYTTEVDAINGKEPTILHATPKGIRVEAKRNYHPSWFVSAFRIRGIVE